MPRTVAVRWDDFEAAFIIGSPDARTFVCLRTGDVEYTSHMDDDTVRQRILGRASGPDWLEIPRVSTDVGMAEIEAFIASEADPELAAALRRSLQERQPFRAFMAALAKGDGARLRWAAARQRGIEDRLLAFCTAHDLVIDDDRFRALVARQAAGVSPH